MSHHHWHGGRAWFDYVDTLVSDADAELPM